MHSGDCLLFIVCAHYFDKLRFRCHWYIVHEGPTPNAVDKDSLLFVVDVSVPTVDPLVTMLLLFQSLVDFDDFTIVRGQGHHSMTIHWWVLFIITQRILTVEDLLKINKTDKNKCYDIIKLIYRVVFKKNAPDTNYVSVKGLAQKVSWYFG